MRPLAPVTDEKAYVIELDTPLELVAMAGAESKVDQGGTRDFYKLSMTLSSKLVAPDPGRCYNIPDTETFTTKFIGTKTCKEWIDIHGFLMWVSLEVLGLC